MSAPKSIMGQLGALFAGRNKVHLNAILEDRCTFPLRIGGAFWYTYFGGLR